MNKLVKPSLYVGCGLTHAPEVFRDSVSSVKLHLTEDWKVLEFLGLNGGTSADVYRHDIDNVQSCLAFLAIADENSTGLGWELGRADALEKPTLIVAQRDAKITRLALGAAESRRHIVFRRYNEISEVPALARESLLPMINKLERNREGVK